VGWREILTSDDPSRAAYEALMASQTGRTAASAIEGAMQGVGNLVGGVERFGSALAVPTRALTAAATNTAGVGPPIDVSDYALHGRDLETGRTALQYGDLLAGTLEDAGEIAPGGAAAKILAFMGNAAADPMMAPAVLSGAEAAGALAGRFRPPAAGGAGRSAMRPRPQSFQTPAQRAYGSSGPVEPMPRQAPFDPTATQPVPTSGEMPFNPTATQKVKARSGWRPSRAAETRPAGGPDLPENPTATQRVPKVKKPKKGKLSERQSGALATARRYGNRG
jgi:hypothetical protein